MNMMQALNSAMDVMLGRDPSVVVMGEDVGYFGGVFRGTDGLQRKYGEHRVLDTPIAEGGIVGSRDRHGRERTAPGRRDPVRRLHLSRRSTRSSASWRAFAIARGGDFARRSRSARRAAAASAAARRTRRVPKRCFAHVCGIKVVMPSNPYDAKGLLITAIEDDDPVIFFEPKRLYNGPFDGDPNKPAVGVELASQGRSARRPLPCADRQRRDRASRQRTSRW